MPDEINAAGAKPGSRLRELGLVLPKPLCPTFRRPGGTRPRRVRCAQRAYRRTGHGRDHI